MHARISDEPRLADKNYKTKYNKQCINLKDGLEVLYEGTGISPNNHPFKKRIRMWGCRNCDNEEVKVIYVRWVVHPMSGDKYWDYEIHCEKCNKYSQYSFAGND